MRSATERGFTLIELMMVVAIIGVLAAIALPAYQDYIIRSKMVEAFSVVDIGKRAVDEYYARWGTFPDSNAQAGLSPPESYRGRNVEELRVAQGVIRVAIGVGAAFEKAPKDRLFAIYLRPMVSKSHPTAPLGWHCSATGKDLASAWFDIVGKAGTDSPPAKYLPAACR